MASMSQAEARRWLKRCRDDLRDAEAALKAGHKDGLLAAVQDAGGCMGELERVLCETNFAGQTGIRGVA
jgi:hypothetical protein